MCYISQIFFRNCNFEKEKMFFFIGNVSTILQLVVKLNSRKRVIYLSAILKSSHAFSLTLLHILTKHGESGCGTPTTYFDEGNGTSIFTNSISKTAQNNRNKYLHFHHGKRTTWALKAATAECYEIIGCWRFICACCLIPAVRNERICIRVSRLVSMRPIRRHYQHVTSWNCKFLHSKGFCKFPSNDSHRTQASGFQYTALNQS